MIIEREEQVTEAVLSETGQVADPRTRQILQSLIRHLHAFAREVRLTEREFNTAINLVSRLGQLTNDNHNETRLIAGSLGLSTLVCLMNNGITSANLLGPFWRQGAPFVENGGSIVRSPTPGAPLFFTGRVVDGQGNPVAQANVDVWHASTRGLYENQDPTQAEWNLRGRFLTDAAGIFRYRSIKPAGYPVPAGGPTEQLLKVQHRHPFRPAHLHALIYKEGYKTIPTQTYSGDDETLESDSQFGVTRDSVGHYVLHENEPAPDADVQGQWYSLEHTYVLEPGESWLPTPPVSAKSKVTAVSMTGEPRNGS
ncbi:MAG TPA: dioxygenase [Steroidobacteraceae bacterium]|jgi:protocatechuate 3,4-dioxygenase beta subunit|nr:dioxygenase [Steroidobacteraceae bacterium]